MKKTAFICLVGLSWLVTSCGSFDRLSALDKGIPRVETPTTLIATICTKTFNGKLIQTRYLDKKGQVLEEYNFGLSSSRIRNEYKGQFTIRSVVHYHSDSSAPGYVDVTEQQYQYDRQGRLEQKIVAREKWERVISYTYTATGDTVKTVRPEPPENKSTLAYVDQWTRNPRGQLVRHYVLYIMQGVRKNNVPDTVWHSSQRYAYAVDGKRVLAWYDYMHLGRYYSPAGPDTIRYQYDRLGRLVAEQHRYTINMANKKEIDSTRLDSLDRRSIQLDRKLFFNGADWRPNNVRTDTIRYSYEAFDPKRHLPLHIPPLN